MELISHLSYKLKTVSSRFKPEGEMCSPEFLKGVTFDTLCNLHV
jgi:hypothetical protein